MAKATKPRAKPPRAAKRSMLDEPPEYSPENEQALIGAILADPAMLDNADVAAVVDADFVGDTECTLWRWFREMRAAGEPIDAVTLMPRIRNAPLRGDGTPIVATVDVARARHACPFEYHAPHYAAHVRQAGERRRNWEAAMALLEASHNGKIPSVARQETIERLLAEGKRDGKNGVEFRGIPSAEFATTQYAVEYLVDHVLARGQCCILAGPKKALKTSLIVDLAIALALGGYFLGKLKVSRVVRVAVMSGESGLATLKETAERICKAAKCDLATLDGLNWCPDLPRFGDVRHLDALERFIVGLKIEVLFIDPAYLCIPAIDNGNLFAQGELLRGVSEVCGRNSVTLVLCHHTKGKGGNKSNFDPPELDDIAWAGFAEWARQWILVGRREKYEPGTGEHRLWLSTGGSAGHSMLWALDVEEGNRNDEGGRRWDVDLGVPSEARKRLESQREQKKIEQAERKEAEHRRKLLDALRKFPQGETAKELRATAGLNPNNFGAAIRALLGEGRAEACSVAKGKRSFDGYRPTGN